jgi:hypothetical protein
MCINASLFQLCFFVLFTESTLWINPFIVLPYKRYRIKNLEQYKQKGNVVSYYVPDDNVLNQIMQKCREEDRSVSQWTYRIIRRTLSNDNENKDNGLQGATCLGKHHAAAAHEEVNSGVAQTDSGST